jgi:tetratricopeptide (TPR) repeat protein
MHPDRPTPLPHLLTFIPGSLTDVRLYDEFEAALELGDLLTASLLAFEISVMHHRIDNFYIAKTYSDLALEIWRAFFYERPTRNHPSVRFTELRMLNAAALQQFNRGHFDVAAERIQEARRLALFMPDSPLLASTEWNTALMERWRRDFPKALAHAQRAWRIYLEQSDPMSVARLSQFIAEVALDCAIQARALGAERKATEYLELAHDHLEYARPPSGEYNTNLIDAKFSMVYATYSRLAGINENRFDLLESIAKFAQRTGDPLFEGQVHHALADELSFLGRGDDALASYGKAFKLLLSSPAPAYAVWPLRALKQEWEYSLDRFASALR